MEGLQHQQRKSPIHSNTKSILEVHEIRHGINIPKNVQDK